MPVKVGKYRELCESAQWSRVGRATVFANSRPVPLAVAAAALHAARGVFHRSGNDVWLVESVPPQYVRELPA